MKLVLFKQPKRVKIVEGFPGFGLIGTIATEFLLEHLDTEKIGIVEFTEAPAMIAIHKNKVIEPISIHYNKKHNLVLVHALNIPKGLEWKIADVVVDLSKKLQATEIISLEGVGSPNATTSRIFFYNTGKNSKKLESFAHPLMEGIIVGVTGALLSKNISTPVTALFAEAKSNLPDSNAAAEIIKALDAYTGLKVDPSPLKAQAKQFEAKLKDIVGKKQKMAGMVQKRDDKLSYVG